jgi:hypothetical protein
MELNEAQREAITLAISLVSSGDHGRAKSVLLDLLDGGKRGICEHRVESGCRNEKNRVGLCHPSHCPVSEETTDWATRKYGRTMIRTTPVQVRDGFIKKIQT